MESGFDCDYDNLIAGRGMSGELLVNNGMVAAAGLFLK